MQKSDTGNCLLLVVLLFTGSPAFALDVGTSLDLGVTHTNNARLAPDNEISDDIATGNVIVTLSQRQGGLNAYVTASLQHIDYIHNTFSNQDYPGLGAVLRLEQIPGRLLWKLDDYYSQLPVDNLGSPTPDNTQNTNTFSFGPDMKFSISPRDSITLGPRFKDFYYGGSTADNQQLEIIASWMHKMTPTLDAGIGGSRTQVSYDNSDLYPDYTINKYYGAVNGSSSRATYHATLGAVHVTSDRNASTDGTTASLDWLQQLSGISTLRLYLLHDITDSSNDLLRTSVDHDTGTSGILQVSGNVLTSDTARLTFRRNGRGGTDAAAWVEWRKSDYPGITQDQQAQEYGTSLGYRITALLSGDLYWTYTRIHADLDSHTDKVNILGAGLGYSLSRKLSIRTTVRLQNKNSTVSTADYRELSIMAGLSYNLFELKRSPDSLSTVSGVR